MRILTFFRYYSVGVDKAEAPAAGWSRVTAMATDVIKGNVKYVIILQLNWFLLTKNDN